MVLQYDRKADLHKPDLGFEISEEAADLLEVSCGHCGLRIKIRSLGHHVKMEHMEIKEFVKNTHRN